MINEEFEGIDDKIDTAKDWSQDTWNHIITPSDNMNELEDDWNKWNGMTKEQRQDSDAKSIELFKMTNKEHYEKIRSKLLANNKDTIEDMEFKEESYSTIDNINVVSDDEIAKNHVQPQNDDKLQVILATKWSKDTMMEIITPTKDLDELEDKWEMWNSMVKRHKEISDDKSIELFGIDNKEHYEQIRSSIINGEKQIDDIPITKNINNVEESSKIEQLSQDIIDELDNIMPDKEKVLDMCMKLSNTEKMNISEELIAKCTVDNAMTTLSGEITPDILDNMPGILPHFEPQQLINLGVYSGKDNYYSEVPDNEYLDFDKKIKTKDWFTFYTALTEGLVYENMRLYTPLWLDKMNYLYSDFDKIKESRDLDRINARKQSILELGWNPEISFSDRNVTLSSALMKDKLKFKFEAKEANIQDVSMLVNRVEGRNVIGEACINEQMNDDGKLYPVYIVLVYTYSGMGKLIRKFTNGIYSHAALSLDNDLKRLYSYNLDPKHMGFSLESVEDYKKASNDGIMVVYSVFVNKSDMLKIKMKLDYFIANKDKTNYSILNLFGILINKPIQIANNMICSQFVDYILKSVNIDLTNKPSGLVVPNDFTKVTSPNMYKLYEGFIRDYKPNRMQKYVNNLKNIKRYFTESALEDDILNDEDGLMKYVFSPFFKEPDKLSLVNEVKEFPVQFDQDGNLLIQRIKSVDFEHEYAQSHKLLELYSKNGNVEGIKYELSKLWFLNLVLEKRIYKEKSTESEIKDYHKVRARILNDFNKYFKEMHKGDPDFNFIEYYNNTPFSDSVTRINNSTLKYSGKALKNLVKMFL